MALLAVLQENTRLVVVSHASNVSGTIFPLKQVAQLCHEKGIPLAVDAAQTAGHHPIDFDGLGLAALCVPGHKGLLGPQGIGAILLEKNFAAALAPLVCGGTGSASDSEWQPAYMPDKFEAGTLNLPGIFGLHAALDFVLEQGVENFQKREAALTAQFLLGLQGLPVRVVGPGDAAAQVGVISLDFSPMDNAEAAYRLEQEFGIMTRCGLHCAPHAHQTMGTFPQGTVRFSFGHTTKEEEVDDVLQAIRRLVAE